MSERLKAKVVAVNKANKYAKELYEMLVPVFQPFVGQKIIKDTGGLYNKVEKALPVLPNTHEVRVYRQSGGYSLAYTIQVNESVPDYGAIYHEVTVYLGNLRNGILTKLDDRKPEGREDWTAEEVQAGREKIVTAREALRDAESAIYPFKEYDS
jgi:hypothetical protein